MSIDMTLPKWVIFTIGVYGEILCLLTDPVEISFLVTLKTLPRIVYKFKLEIAKKSYRQKAFDKLI